MVVRFAIVAALAFAALPLGSAHLTNPNGSWTSGLFTEGGVCRYGGTTTEGTNGGDCSGWLNSGVSGTYVGAAGISVETDLTPHIAIPITLCDFEVLGLGDDDVGYPQDEQAVDNDQTTGLVPDGTFDDGGFGGACHTHTYDEDDPQCTLGTDVYVKGTDNEATDCDSFNTYNCSGTSHAQDLVSGDDVFIMAACDEVTIEAGPCSNPCIGDMICLTEEPCGSETLVSCGADGLADEVSFGQGGGDFWGDAKKFPAGLASHGGESPGVDYPPLEFPECASQAVAATFVLNAVDVHMGEFLSGVLGETPIGSKGSSNKDHDTVTGAGAAASSLLRTLAKKPELAAISSQLEEAADVLNDLATGAPNVKYSLATAGWIDWTAGSTGNALLAREPTICNIIRTVTETDIGRTADLLRVNCDGNEYSPRNPGPCRFTGKPGDLDRTVRCRIGTCERKHVIAIANLNMGATSVSTDITCGFGSVVGGPALDNVADGDSVRRHGNKTTGDYRCIVRFIWDGVSTYNAAGTCRHANLGNPPRSSPAVMDPMALLAVDFNPPLSSGTALTRGVRVAGGPS